MECSECGHEVEEDMLVTKTKTVENPLYGGPMEDTTVVGCMYCTCGKCKRSGVYTEEAHGVMICGRCV